MILGHQRVDAECCPSTSPNLSLLQFASLMDSLNLARILPARRRRRKLVIELDKPVDGVLAALKTLNKGTVEANMNIYGLQQL
jgi:hypothetical protein